MSNKRSLYFRKPCSKKVSEIIPINFFSKTGQRSGSKGFEKKLKITFQMF